jgi:hypothetical protein
LLSRASKRSCVEQIYPAIGWGASVPEGDLLKAVFIVVVDQVGERSEFGLRLCRSGGGGTR